MKEKRGEVLVTDFLRRERSGFERNWVFRIWRKLTGEYLTWREVEELDRKSINIYICSLSRNLQNREETQFLRLRVDMLVEKRNRRVSPCCHAVLS
jgi:hypothetical protein